MTVNETAKELAKALENKKGKEILIIDVSEKTIIADYFIICSGTSNTQVKTLSDEVAKRAKDLGLTQRRIEGYNAARWIVQDFGDILVHIFYPEEREFYDIERLWIDDNNVERFGNAD